MTRLALASFGCGVTLTLLLASLWGTQTCVGLSFSAGIAFTLLVLALTLWGLYLTGKRLGWIDSFTPDHSQPLDGPKDTSPY